MKKTLIVIIALIVIAVLYVFSSYNGLVTLRENATAQWQNVEAQYQRRFDLIPNLTASVQGVLTQEKTVFGDIAEARTRYAGAQTVNEKAAAASDVESSLGRLLVIIENYPTLKSSDTVQNLMTQLEGTENRISVERNRYNDEVRTYEVAIKRFPTSLTAAIFGFDDMTYFEAQTGAENAPKVQLQ